MSGKSARRKGFGAEWEIGRILKSNGIPYKRSYGSRYPDLIINGRPVSVKRRKKELKWIYDELDDPNPHDYVLYRIDRYKWLKFHYWKP